MLRHEKRDEFKPELLKNSPTTSSSGFFIELARMSLTQQQSCIICCSAGKKH